MTDTSSNPHHD